MHTPFAFLRFAAKAALNAVGGGMMGELLVEVVPEVALDVWQNWGERRTPQEMKDEIEELAQASPQEVREQAKQIVETVAPDASEDIQLELVTYLQQVPAAIRQSLRRPADPSGTSLPATFTFSKSEDLVPLLPSKMPRFQPGEQPKGIGDWELVELLGMGGFGEVWKARNPHVPNAAPVALKFCLDETTTKMLRHEAAILDRVMSQGRHPGIVELRHTYLGAEPPCLEYEFVEGGELSTLVHTWHRMAKLPAPGKPNPIFAQATNMIRDLSEIVAFAHQLSPPIVHRDLKPANILVARGENGRPSLRVADFGIGALAAKQQIVSTTTGSQSRSEFLVTALRGSHTPLYASPQQSRGDPPDPRDDVHAIGVIWYQMLTGKLANGRPGGTRWTKRLLEQGMDEGLLELLVDCIEDDLEDRPESAGVLFESLEKLAPKQSTPSQRSERVEADAPVAVVETTPSTDVVNEGRPPTISVSSLGRGEYTSLAEAVRDAPRGAKIIVHPGLYSEGIVLDKPLEIVGEGDRRDIVLQSSESACVEMRTDYATVKGLTLRCRCESTRTKNYAVDVPRGQLVLENCDITSDTSACIGVRGRQSDPIIRDCHIHDGTSAGIFFYDESLGMVDRCVIESNRHAGIAISTRSNPVIRGCEIHHGNQVGVHVYEYGTGTIEDCEIYGHNLNGIEMKQGANPTVRRCTIKDGVLAWDEAKGILEECDISGNSAPELAVSTGATPTVRRCRIHDSEHGGVLIYERGLGLFEDCDIVSNALNGVEIRDGGNPVFRQCRIRRNRYRAIYIHKHSSVTAEFCDLTENAQGAWYITPECTVHRTSNDE